MNPTPFTLGLDLGQSFDFSALALLEQTNIPLPFDPVTYSHPTSTVYDLRFLRRFPKGTPYPAVIDFLSSILSAPPLFHRTALVCDATGLGAPFLDMLRRANLSAPIIPIVLTAPLKTDIIGALSFRLLTNTLRIPANLPHRDLLFHELLHFRAKFSPTGHLRLESQRPEDHDDLLIALALACWHNRPKPEAGPQPNRLL